MLAETQPYIDQELQLRENRKRVHELEEERRALRARVVEIERTITGIALTPVPVVTAATSERREFTQPCAAHGCDGFLAPNWQCRKCKKATCRSCGVPCV